MSSPSTTPTDRCSYADSVSAYALGALAQDEASRFAAHLSVCRRCDLEHEGLRQVVDLFAVWPTDVLRPSRDLWSRLQARIGLPKDEGSSLSNERRVEPPWEKPAPGISCKLLSNDAAEDRVAMLVRLAPGTAYPPHTHSGTEELHLLDGELWIDEKKLRPGEYNRGERGASDRLVWSETGCTCLLITSPSDVLG